MNLADLVALQLTAHFVADFYLQPQAWCEEKAEASDLSWTQVKHAALVSALAWLLSGLALSFVLYALFIGLTHLFIDLRKSQQGPDRERAWYDGGGFLTDQVMHIVMVLAASCTYWTLTSDKWDIFGSHSKEWAILCMYVICGKPTNFFIKAIMTVFDVSGQFNQGEESDTLVNAGKLIGICERGLTLTFVLLNQFAAVGFLITAKSILRHDSNAEREYVLIGTLLSFGAAVLAGILVSLLP